jgi:flagellin
LTAGTNDFFDDTLATNANAINTGFVNGAVTNVKVGISGQAYEVSINVGNQTFKGRLDSSNNTAGDLVTLTSTNSSANTIQWEVANDIGTGGSLAVSEEERNNVEAGLRILLSGATYTAINSDGNSVDNGFTGIGSTVGVDQNGTTVSIKAGAGTNAGTYQFQYISTGAETATGATGFTDTGDERRGIGYFLLSNGVESLQVDQKDIQLVGEEGAAGAYGIVTFTNGLQVYLDTGSTAGNAFDRGTSSTAAYRFDVGTGGGVSLSFQVSDKATDQVSVGFSSATASALGLEGLSVADVGSAATASARIDNAINIVNTAQATLGAVQSRFEYIQTTIATTVENVSASRGIFRDVDMASEMTAFTRSQTLMQASISMLSQANQMPQQLLRLLQ